MQFLSIFKKNCKNWSKFEYFQCWQGKIVSNCPKIKYFQENVKIPFNFWKFSKNQPFLTFLKNHATIHPSNSQFRSKLNIYLDIWQKIAKKLVKIWIFSRKCRNTSQLMNNSNVNHQNHGGLIKNQSLKKNYLSSEKYISQFIINYYLFPKNSNYKTRTFPPSMIPFLIFFFFFSQSTLHYNLVTINRNFLLLFSPISYDYYCSLASSGIKPRYHIPLPLISPFGRIWRTAEPRSACPTRQTLSAAV